MEKTVKKYNLKDPMQYQDEKLFWENQTIEFKLDAMERLREDWIKMNNNGKFNEDFKRLRRVLRIVKQK